MKKALTLLLLLACVFTLSGCTKKVESIVLSAPSLELQVEKKVILSAVILPEDAAEEITWISSDETVAKVDETGLVTAVAPGATSIIVTSESGVSATCSVTVLEKSAYDRLSKDSKRIVDGVKKALSNFKNPDSVKVQGVAEGSKKWYLKITAQNGFGGFTTAYYEMSTNGTLTPDLYGAIEGSLYDIFYEGSYSANKELDLINEALHE